MTSLIPGYEYDIFISYRQKDNKHDGWVTEFVNNLKGELESTFKEEVSVYFDINPHDGLLETHDVDASLKEKLRCLVFIPIISRTYCDPKAFAWEHEFKAFIDLASKDRYGLKVKLAGGNVASRVLPVQIHDIDPGDRKLVEDELGGFIRGIEFIYREPGINKPLKPDDDEKKNLNKTKYSYQINKVANAVQEIISGLIAVESREEQGFPEEESDQQEMVVEEAVIRHKKRGIGIIVGLVLIIFVGSLLVFQLLGRKNSDDKQLEKSIAVLPFHNYSGDPNQEYMSDGLTDEIISHLYKIKSFDKVVSLSSVLTYKGTEKRLPQIADELKVNYILEGTYKKVGDEVRVTAQLIEPKNDKHLWQQDYDQPYREIIAIQSDIALKIAANINAFLTGSEKQNIQKIPTTNLEAYDLMQQANNLILTFSRGGLNLDYDFFRKGIGYAMQAIKLDPGYADAYAGTGAYLLFSGAYMGNTEFSDAVMAALPYINKALELDQNNSLAHYTMGIISEWGQWDYVRAEKEYMTAIDLEPNKVDNTYSQYIDFYNKMNQPEKAIYYIRKAAETDPGIPLGTQVIKSFVLSGNRQGADDSLRVYSRSRNMLIWKWVGESYIWLGEYDSARFYLESSAKGEDPEMFIPRFQAYLAFVYNKTYDLSDAQSIIYKLMERTRESSAGSPEYFIGWYYSGIGKIDSAFYWLEKAYNKRSAEMPWFKVDPVFKNLKGDQRYWDLYERTGHKAYDDYIKSLKK